jgi:hypothetical protein
MYHATYDFTPVNRGTLSLDFFHSDCVCVCLCLILLLYTDVVVKCYLDELGATKVTSVHGNAGLDVFKPRWLIFGNVGFVIHHAKETAQLVRVSCMVEYLCRMKRGFVHGKSCKHKAACAPCPDSLGGVNFRDCLMGRNFATFLGNLSAEDLGRVCIGFNWTSQVRDVCPAAAYTCTC